MRGEVPEIDVLARGQHQIVGKGLGANGFPRDELCAGAAEERFRALAEGGGVIDGEGDPDPEIVPEQLHRVEQPVRRRQRPGNKENRSLTTERVPHAPGSF
ncbi:hypothetical protein ACPZ19_42190 [Amycolatopsis lurida]